MNVSKSTAGSLELIKAENGSDNATKIHGTIAAPVALLGASLFLVHEPVLLAVGDNVVIQDELQPADGIHDIAGPDHRTDYSIRLYKRGYEKRIFFLPIHSVIVISDPHHMRKVLWTYLPAGF